MTHLEVTLPEEYTVTGDLTRRRGIIKAMEGKPAVRVTQEAVLLAELFGIRSIG